MYFRSILIKNNLLSYPSMYFRSILIKDNLIQGLPPLNHHHGFHGLFANVLLWYFHKSMFFTTLFITGLHYFIDVFHIHCLAIDDPMNLEIISIWQIHQDLRWSHSITNTLLQLKPSFIILMRISCHHLSSSIRDVLILVFPYSSSFIGRPLLLEMIKLMHFSSFCRCDFKRNTSPCNSNLVIILMCISCYNMSPFHW